MSRFFLKIFIFVAITIALVPLYVSAETITSDAEAEEISQLKVQILQLQIEILKAQIALLAGNVQTGSAASVAQKNNCAQLEISWDSIQKATSYRLYRNSVAVYEGRERTFIDSGLTLGEKYKYVVYGLYQGVEGDPSEVQEMTAPDICPPAVPSLTFKAEPCGGQITISWLANSQATIYQLFRGNKEIYSGSLSWFVDSGLTPGKKYEYKVRTGNKGGWSDFSTVFSFQSSGLCASSEPEVSYVIPGVSQEGTILIETKSSPSNNTKLRAERTNQSVVSFKLEAEYSDISIARIDLFFDCKAWLYLDKVKVQYAGRTVEEKEIDRDSFVRVEDFYRLRFENIQAVVKEGKSGTITVKVDTKEIQPGNEANYISIFLENNSIRAVDKAGLWQYAPISGGGKGGSFSRIFRVEQEKEE